MHVQLGGVQVVRTIQKMVGLKLVHYGVDTLAQNRIVKAMLAMLNSKNCTYFLALPSLLSDRSCYCLHTSHKMYAVSNSKHTTRPG